MKFNRSWTLWEHYERVHGRGKPMDYSQSMAKVCWFNDLVSLAVAWNSIPHTQLSNVFYDDATQKCRFI